MDAMRAGAVIVAGTDRPLAIKLHGDLTGNVQIGLTPYEALKTATANAAQALGLDAGTIEAGKLADIVMVEGNPLENIENTHRVKRVIANGRAPTKSTSFPKDPPARATVGATALNLGAKIELQMIAAKPR